MRGRRYKIIFLACIFTFWSLLLFDIRAANDFPWISGFSLLDRFNLPQLWTTQGAVGLGEYGLAVLWGWPLNFLYGLGAKLGFGFAILERLLGIIPFILLGIYSIGKLFDHLKVNGWAKLVGSLFYLTNTYILLVIDGGQLHIALAYALFPLAYLRIIKSIGSNLKEKLLAGVAVAMLGFFDIRFVYILLLLIVFKFFYELVFVNYKKWLGEIWSWIKTGFVIGLVFVGLHAYWIVPALLARAPQLPAGYADVSQASFLSFATLGHALLLLQPHWYKNVFGKVISLQPEFYLIPILVFLAPVLQRTMNKNQETEDNEQKSIDIGFWLIIALIGAFLVKGSLEPWEAFYPFIFKNIPGMSMFRDPTKFFFLVGISYSVLIGYTTMFLTKRFGWNVSTLINPRGETHSSSKLMSLTSGVFRKGATLIYKKLKSSAPGEYFLGLKIIPLILIVYFLLLVSPVWTGQMTGTFSEPYNKQEFLAAADKIKEDRYFGRILYIPSRPPMGYASPTHPSIEASRLLSLRPFSLGTVGTYETLNYLREAGYMGELLDISAVSYLAYPHPDERREELKEDNVEYYYAFWEQLSDLSWTGDVISDPPTAVVRTRESQDHIFVAGNKFNVVGSLEILNEMVGVPEFELENNMLNFTEFESNLKSGSTQSAVHEKYLLYNKNELDLAACFIDKRRMVSPSDILPRDPSENSGQAGWWKREGSNVIEWRSFLQEKYGIDNQDFPLDGGWAVAEGEKKLEINRKTPAIKGDHLLARVMISSKGGEIEFFTGEEKVGVIDTKIVDPETVEIYLAGYQDIAEQTFEFNKAEFHWVEIGQLPVNLEPIEIKTTGEINVINQIAFVHEQDWAEHKRKVVELLDTGNVLEWDELSLDEKEILFRKQISPQVTYERLSSTEYRLSVDENIFPAYLVFSEAFDDGWRIKRLSDGLMLKPEPAYTFLNGFVLPSAGEYRLFFEPQKYVLPGLFVSVMTLAVVLFFLAKKKR